MIKLKSYQDLIISEQIELPEIVELLKYPFFNKADIDFCYKNANCDVKYLLDKIPLQNDRKYISVRLTVQYLTPNVVSVPRASWHFDTLSSKEDEICHTHLLISKCSAMTEFSENEISLLQFNEINEKLHIEQFINKNSFMFKAKACPANSFITFSGFQPHRCTRAKQNEFRFMFRIIESNFLKPNRPGQILDFSEVYVDNHDMSNLSLDYVKNKKIESKKSIEKIDNKVVIHSY